MSEREIKMLLESKIEEIAKAIHRGKDVEVVKTSSGIVIKEISKKKLA